VCEVAGEGGADGALDGFFGSWEFGGFFKGLSWSGYLACICLAILGGLLGKRTIECMELWSTFPPFYRTYLIEEWYYNSCSLLLAIFPHLPEDTVAKPGCSKT
jgi:hypothetical protein